MPEDLTSAFLVAGLLGFVSTLIVTVHRCRYLGVVAFCSLLANFYITTRFDFFQKEVGVTATLTVLAILSAGSSFSLFVLICKPKIRNGFPVIQNKLQQEQS